jgi:DNA-binding NtrC family response regulator
MLARVAARLGQAPLVELLAEAQAIVEVQLIDAALSRTGGQLHHAAALLDVPAEDLVLRLRRLGMPLPPLN